ncbi:hypothetical protein H4217_003327 [Coemansia sp. RSA 1939]|nr:hypothetical protein H4217_003327 [Coemansia sp. RSA 1939]KAJ2608313.1 hypothetical protein EV177_005039 [Coemansia sp. RSA 1804]KAJ2693803.1 hypothetical protein GGH99_000979 [Coemansia sp. RSA 1285]
MPLCNIITNVQAHNAKALSIKASALVAELLSKPQSYVLSMVTHNSSLTFGGTDEPTACLHIWSIGSVGGDKNRPLFAGITKLVADELGIKPSRINIYTRDVDISDYGINGDILSGL